MADDGSQFYFCNDCMDNIQGRFIRHGGKYIFTPIYFLLVMLWEWKSYYRNNGKVKYPMLDLDKPVHLGLFTAEILLILGLAYFGNGAFIYNQF